MHYEDSGQEACERAFEDEEKQKLCQRTVQNGDTFYTRVGEIEFEVSGSISGTQHIDTIKSQSKSAITDIKTPEEIEDQEAEEGIYVRADGRWGVIED